MNDFIYKINTDTFLQMLFSMFYNICHVFRDFYNNKKYKIPIKKSNKNANTENSNSVLR